METHNLIEELSRDLKPVKRLSPPGLRFLGWSVLACGLVGLGVLSKGTRGDLGEISHHWRFFAEAFLSFGVALSAGLTAFFLSVPGDERWRRSLSITVVLSSSWLLLLSSRFIFSASNIHLRHLTFASGGPCGVELFLLSFLPSIAMLWMVRRAAPFRFNLTSGLGVLAASSISVLGLQLMCHGESPVHVFVWHLLPVFLTAAIGAVVGRWAIKR